ncbi:hypothetical protein DFH06DRAFT_1156037 [Mycena polygramma]|nr:hypothetical protein DFH06DRAFT_1156037 [Mycena polygramma]
MPHKHHRTVHRAAIFLGVLLVLIVPHLVLLLAQSPSSSQSHLRVKGRWAAVRHSLQLPPLAAYAEPPKLPQLSLHMSSRFDLKRKRALEESTSPRAFAFTDVATPPQLYFATDAVEGPQTKAIAS